MSIKFKKTHSHAFQTFLYGKRGVSSMNCNRHICNSKITGRPISWTERAESPEWGAMCAFVSRAWSKRSIVAGTGSSKSAVSQRDAISSGGFCSPKASGNYEDKSVFSIPRALTQWQIIFHERMTSSSWKKFVEIYMCCKISASYIEDIKFEI